MMKTFGIIVASVLITGLISGSWKMWQQKQFAPSVERCEAAGGQLMKAFNRKLYCIDNRAIIDSTRSND